MPARMPFFIIVSRPTDNKAARRRLCCEHLILALRELMALARLVQAPLLALDRARVTRDQPRLLERRLERRVILDQRARDAVPHGARLPPLTAALHVDHDVEAGRGLRHSQRLAR